MEFRNLGERFSSRRSCSFNAAGSFYPVANENVTLHTKGISALLCLAQLHAFLGARAGDASSGEHSSFPLWEDTLF